MHINAGKNENKKNENAHGLSIALYREEVG